jgi:hypothetical protein
MEAGVIKTAQTEAEFRQFCDTRENAGVANEWPGGIVIHRAGCSWLKGGKGNHVEGLRHQEYIGYSGSTPVFRTKWMAATVDELKVKWPGAHLCTKCL